MMNKNCKMFLQELLEEQEKLSKKYKFTRVDEFELARIMKKLAFAIPNEFDEVKRQKMSIKCDTLATELLSLRSQITEAQFKMIMNQIKEIQDIAECEDEDV